MLLFFTHLKRLTMEKKNESKAMSLTVTEGLTVTIIPNSTHEFLMTTTEVANGYGTSKYVVQKSMLRNSAELTQGKHYLKGVDILSTPFGKRIAVQPQQVFWTKRGIIRLGFFIKSEQSKLFRDWAEELVLEKLTQPTLFDVQPTRQLPTARKHNRLTSDRMIDLLADVCKIEDKDLRLSITSKLMGGREA